MTPEEQLSPRYATATRNYVFRVQCADGLFCDGVLGTFDDVRLSVNKNWDLPPAYFTLSCSVALSLETHSCSWRLSAAYFVPSPGREVS